MSSSIEILLGGALGAILMYWGYNLFRKKRQKDITKQQSALLLEKIHRVCKLISVQGDFAEIYQYENTKEHFISLFSSKKKALIVIKAKAHIGYDLKKIIIHANTAQKKIELQHFPEPEILSIEPDLQFYDIKNGLFNSFTPEDLTAANAEAKQRIKEKIPESGLMDSARQEALEVIAVITQLVETIDWQLDISKLELDTSEKNRIENSKQ